MIWMMLTLWMSEPVMPPEIRELVYRAEVYGEQAHALESLRRLLDSEDVSERRIVAYAMSTIKYQPDALGTEVDLIRTLERPRGMVRSRGQIYLLVGRGWLEIGDWIGDYYLEDISDKIIMVRRDGIRTEIELIGTWPQEDAQCLLRNAPLDEVLLFLSRRAGFDAFLPSDLDQAISGRFSVVDVISLLDSISSKTGLSWTRNRDNIIFKKKVSVAAQTTSKRGALFRTVERRGENLALFLHNLADTFGLELILDETIADVTVDIYAQEQPWDETLDCLAMMNDFTWDLLEEDSERPKLVIHAP